MGEKLQSLEVAFLLEGMFDHSPMLISVMMLSEGELRLSILECGVKLQIS